MNTAPQSQRSTRRTGLLAGLIAFALAPAPAWSQAAQAAADLGGWPNKPARIVAPFAPGGSTERLSRLVAQRLQESFGQPFVIESRPGAGGAIGSDLVAKSAPDGYTLLLSSLASQIITPVAQKTAYDGLRDFTHLAVLGGPPTAIILGPAMQAKDLKEFIAEAKARAGGVTYGSPGAGSHAHLLGQVFNQKTGVNLVHVPYKGAGGVITDVVGGHLPSALITISSVITQIKAGKARAIAHSGTRRAPDLPDVPTFAELGLPDLTGITWFGISGPAKLPAPVAAAVNREIRKAMASEPVREALRPEGFEIMDLDLAQTTEFFRKENARWQPIARAAGVRNE